MSFILLRRHKQERILWKCSCHLDTRYELIPESPLDKCSLHRLDVILELYFMHGMVYNCICPETKRITREQKSNSVFLGGSQ